MTSRIITRPEALSPPLNPPLGKGGLGGVSSDLLTYSRPFFFTRSSTVLKRSGCLGAIIRLRRGKSDFNRIKASRTTSSSVSCVLPAIMTGPQSASVHSGTAKDGRVSNFKLPITFIRSGAAPRLLNRSAYISSCTQRRLILLRTSLIKKAAFLYLL